MNAKQVLDAALRLPVEARAALADELQVSLESGEGDADRTAAWSEEIRRRLDAFERGEVAARPAAEVLSRLRAVARGTAA